jgi:hypothetical protein
MYGLYYTLGPDTAFDKLVFSRLDTTVNFLWDKAAPATSLPADFFGVRWLGYIEPAFSEEHFFQVNSDDGFRLWVDGQLLADEWRLKGPGEVSASIFLEKGKRYPIEVAYFEWQGEAAATLSWSSASMPKEVLPKWRLFPRLPENPGVDNKKFDLRIFPNPVRNRLTLLVDSEYREVFDIRLIDAAGRMVREWRDQEVELFQEQLTWPVSNLQAGVYWLEVAQADQPPVILPFVKL